MAPPFNETNGVMPGSSPLISLVLSVRNGLPYLREALDSVAALTYRNFELVVQDACSTDGTLELLKEYASKLPMSLVSERDAGIADGYYRAVRRCRGQIIGSIDADNVLEANGLEAVAARFAEDPFLHALYGSTKMFDESTGRETVWVPPEFDLLRLMSCEVVPPFATSFFSKIAFEQVIGTRPEPLYPICGDYAIWLAVGHLRVVRIPEIIGTTRLSGKSHSCNPEHYERMCGVKEDALRRYLAQLPSNRISQLYARQAYAGIYLWGAASLMRIEGIGGGYSAFIEKARAFDPNSPRLQALPAANPTAAGAPLERPDRAPDFVLTELSGEDCSKGLEKNLYGNVHQEDIGARNGCAVFFPRTDDDHLATPSVPVAVPVDQRATRLVSVDVTFPPLDAEVSRGVITIQDQAFNQLSVLRVEENATSLRYTSVLPANATALRATFAGRKGQYNYLPLQLTLGVYLPPA